MSKNELQKVFLHLLKTKQAFCFLANGQLVSLEEVMTCLYGREVTSSEAMELLEK